MNHEAWQLIFDKYRIKSHSFQKIPFIITAEQIKSVTKQFRRTADREVRVLCKQDTRESRPLVFQQEGLFVLPIRNGTYAIVKGDGYVDIPEITSEVKKYRSPLDFQLDTSLVGNSEMQHLDFAFASGLIPTFIDDKSLVLTIRGRKYTPQFDFFVKQAKITAIGVQTEVDAGYEGKAQVILIEAKNFKTDNTIIRQLYYPFRQWQTHTKKPVKTLFFEKRANHYFIWEFQFKDEHDYNSIELIQSARFEIVCNYQDCL